MCARAGTLGCGVPDRVLASTACGHDLDALPWRHVFRIIPGRARTAAAVRDGGPGGAHTLATHYHISLQSVQ